jgi:hypothetical protein
MGYGSSEIVTKIAMGIMLYIRDERIPRVYIMLHVRADETGGKDGERHLSSDLRRGFSEPAEVLIGFLMKQPARDLADVGAEKAGEALKLPLFPHADAQMDAFLARFWAGCHLDGVTLPRVRTTCQAPPCAKVSKTICSDPSRRPRRLPRARRCRDRSPSTSPRA